ncbi:hypothetical protein BC832DRAFT_318117 [Gaertneriomyces semiglobifer]|nr:hypothetical protein BC832DRAFT_596387 [Gaertneriomyces semiglobifer]KAI8995869.1 hypothetical protein BC832DRAFT_318117 [Gaertneriomyces semiglobifer]
MQTSGTTGVNTTASYNHGLERVDSKIMNGDSLGRRTVTFESCYPQKPSGYARRGRIPTWNGPSDTKCWDDNGEDEHLNAGDTEDSHENQDEYDSGLTHSHDPDDADADDDDDDEDDSRRHTEAETDLHEATDDIRDDFQSDTECAVSAFSPAPSLAHSRSLSFSGTTASRLESVTSPPTPKPFLTDLWQAQARFYSSSPAQNIPTARPRTIRRISSMSAPVSYQPSPARNDEEKEEESLWWGLGKVKRSSLIAPTDEHGFLGGVLRTWFGDKKPSDEDLARSEGPAHQSPRPAHHRSFSHTYGASFSTSPAVSRVSSSRRSLDSVTQSVHHDSESEEYTNKWRQRRASDSAPAASDNESDCGFSVADLDECMGSMGLDDGRQGRFYGGWFDNDTDHDNGNDSADDEPDNEDDAEPNADQTACTSEHDESDLDTPTLRRPLAKPAVLTRRDKRVSTLSSPPTMQSFIYHQADELPLSQSPRTESTPSWSRLLARRRSSPAPLSAPLPDCPEIPRGVKHHSNTLPSSPRRVYTAPILSTPSPPRNQQGKALRYTIHVTNPVYIPPPSTFSALLTRQKGYTLYWVTSVEGEKVKARVGRRYREFRDLWEQVELFINSDQKGKFSELPSMPARTMFRRFDKKVVEERRVAFESLLKWIADHAPVLFLPVVQEFLGLTTPGAKHGATGALLRVRRRLTGRSNGSSNSSKLGIWNTRKDEERRRQGKVGGVVIWEIGRSNLKRADSLVRAHTGKKGFSLKKGRKGMDLGWRD